MTGPNQLSLAAMSKVRLAAARVRGKTGRRRGRLSRQHRGKRDPQAVQEQGAALLVRSEKPPKVIRA